MNEPLLFLDVDGTLLPFAQRIPVARLTGHPGPRPAALSTARLAGEPGALPTARPAGDSGALPTARPTGDSGALPTARLAGESGARPAGNPLLDRLDPGDGACLRALGCQLVWATTWGAEANEVLSPRLGLPELPVLDWPEDDDDPPPGVHWKTTVLVRWAAGRPFAWLDDEIFDADRRWIASHHPAAALAHRVDPRSGLTAADFAAVQRWLAGLISLR